MRVGSKKLLVIGDRVLITPEVGEERTKVGLLLPPSAIEKNAVQSGRIVEVGPGIPIPSPNDVNDEPWKTQDSGTQYIAMEARPGDFALFLRNAATEIVFEGTKYLVVPHAALLLIIRDEEAALPDVDYLSPPEF